ARPEIDDRLWDRSDHPSSARAAGLTRVGLGRPSLARIDLRSRGAIDEGWTMNALPSRPDPLGHQPPRVAEFPVQRWVIRFERFEKHPVATAVIHLLGVRQLMKEDVSHEVMRQEHEPKVETDSPLR